MLSCSQQAQRGHTASACEELLYKAQESDRTKEGCALHLRRAYETWALLEGVLLHLLRLCTLLQCDESIPQGEQRTKRKQIEAMDLHLPDYTCYARALVIILCGAVDLNMIFYGVGRQ